MDTGYSGRYPVHEAGRVQLLQLLMLHGAQLNVHDDDGQTPLHLASQHSHIRIVHELVAGGADWRAVDHCSRSALHHAALGNAVFVRLLTRFNHCLTKAGQGGQLPPGAGGKGTQNSLTENIL